MWRGYRLRALKIVSQAKPTTVYCEESDQINQGVLSMPGQFTSDIDSEWRRLWETCTDVRKLDAEYDLAIIGVGTNRFGQRVLLYSWDKLFDLFYAELRGEEPSDDAEINDRCTELVSGQQELGDNGDGRPLILDGPFEQATIEADETCCRYYTINGEHWRGELVDDSG